MTNKLVSIIVLSYNNMEYIKENIDSILIQDYTNIELIIADDGSDEFDSNYYQKYIKEYSKGNITNIIVYKNCSNLGTVKNINKAISLSKGEYIKFIAADDVFYKNEVISNMVKYMENNKSIILSTPVLKCDENMNERFDSQEYLKRIKSALNLGQNPQKLLKLIAKENLILAPGMMFRRILFEKYGLFDEEYILLEDWPMWLKLLRHNVRFDYLDMISVKYRVGVGISTSDTPNPIILNDSKKCIEKEIIPYKKQLGYWLHKNIKYSYIRIYKFKEYSILKKLLFILVNIDILCINQIKKIKSKLKRNNNNEN